MTKKLYKIFLQDFLWMILKTTESAIKAVVEHLTASFRAFRLFARYIAKAMRLAPKSGNP